ncbi:hypothetical protein LCGC14_0504160 [marine sediment metagenome]|uniref:Uncharacterized protein n=1 Tax=marine sediment metagenome TaxID=412755 RepID=A0A0F9UPY0_9ZZZZ
MAENNKAINVTLPEQVDVMIEAVAMLGNGKFPNPAGYKPKETTKKDVMGYILFRGAYTFLKDNGFLDAIVRSWEMHNPGKKFNHEMYDFSQQEVQKETVDMLAGIDANPEV